MNLEQIAARAAEIDTELAELEARTEWSDEDRARFEALNAEITTLAEQRADIERRAELRARAANLANVEQPVGIPAVNVNRNADPYDLSTLRFGAPASELRGRARTAIERTDFIPDAAREAVTRKLDRVSDVRGVIPGLVLYTGNEHYQRAFHKGLAGRADLWTAEERAAVERTEEFRAAMSLTDANGGYAIPFTLDPTLILTGDGSSNPFRQISRVETITTDTWNGLSSAGVTASWDGENAEVSDDSPTFLQPTATTKKAQAFVQGSIEISQDYRNLAADLAMLFAAAKDDLEAAAFATGATGGNNPAGIVPLVVAYDSGSSIKTSATTDTFAVADVYNTQNQTPPRYRGRSSWVANNAIINLIRQFGTANNYHGFLVDLGAAQPSQLLGRPLFEASAMDGAIGGGAENYVLVNGDFSQFLIADRVGLAVEFIPHLFATGNNRPSGTRGWYAYWRVGTALLNGDAFTVLNVT